MPENLETQYQSIPVVEQGPRVSWKRFYVNVSGRTNGAHGPWVSKLRYAGQIQENSPVQSDYTLLFCPIASRVGTDISEALENIPDNKPVILVVMHHTFNRDHVVAESRRQVNDPRVRLVVDTLFFEGRPLESHVNEYAWDRIKSFLGAEVPSCSPSKDWWTLHKGKVLIAVIVLVFLILVAILAGTL